MKALVRILECAAPAASPSTHAQAIVALLHQSRQYQDLLMQHKLVQDQQQTRAVLLAALLELQPGTTTPAPALTPSITIDIPIGPGSLTALLQGISSTRLTTTDVACLLTGSPVRSQDVAALYPSVAQAMSALESTFATGSGLRGPTDSSKAAPKYGTMSATFRSHIAGTRSIDTKLAANDEMPTDLDLMTPKFPVKLFKLVLDAELNHQKHIIQFTEDGDAILLHDRKALMHELVPKHLRLTNFASFRRQMCLYGFEKREHRSSLVYRHALFHRDRPRALSKLRRKDSRPGRATRRDLLGTSQASS